MTVKLLAFLKAMPGMKRSKFEHYYETRHVPLVLRLMPGIVEYRRNYLPEVVAGFDVVTEIWFKDRATMEAAMMIASTGVIGEQIARDEENFLDRSATKVAFPDERGGMTA